LRDHVAGEVGGEIEPTIERLEARRRERAVEPPTPDRADRIAAQRDVLMKIAFITARMSGCRPRGFDRKSLKSAAFPCRTEEAGLM
jgi:hypothetical protein